MPPRSSSRSRATNNPADDSEHIPDLPPIEEEPRQQSPASEPRAPSPVPEPITQGTPFDDQSTPNLAQAIMLMTQELRRRENGPRKAKAKEPDTFDGSDPRKLNNFILLCNLYFRNNSSYDEDETKVTFALSYLRGTALEYFEPAILDTDDMPLWMDNWSAFVRTLRVQFGPIDPTADAEDGIDNLRMHDNQRIVKYNVEFNRLAVRTGWDDSVLRYRYYSGLAERIKDIMGQQGKPATLEAMKTLAHSIDSCHWERLREKSRSNRNNKSDTAKSDNHKSDDKGKNASSSSSGSNNKKTGNSHSHSNSDNHGHTHNHGQKSGKSASSSSGNSASISDKLGKDGKLTQQERQRRFDNNLCMFCGGVGHTAKDCPKSTSSAAKAKGRAAQVQTKTKEKEPSEPKKE